MAGILLAAGVLSGITGEAAAEAGPGAASGPTRIGKEALIPLPEAAEWSGLVNCRPGDGEIVKLNPPLFSWLQKEPGNENSALDRFPRTYRFQVVYATTEPATVVDFDALVISDVAVNVDTESNMYNFLAPLNPPAGKKCWWRVGYRKAKWYSGTGAPGTTYHAIHDFYLDTTSGDLYVQASANTWVKHAALGYSGAGAPGTTYHAIGDWYQNTTNGDVYQQNSATAWTKSTRFSVLDIYSWSTVRTFTIADAAEEWDRSMLADETYLKSKEHPRLLFSKNNREAFSKHVQVNDPEIWLAIKKVADAAIISPWWADKSITYTTSHGKLPDLQAVAFVWQMTKAPKYLNSVATGRAQELLVLLAQEFIDNGSAFVDSSNGFGGIERLGQIYDWLYEVMTPEQRESVAANIGLHCKFSLNVFIFRNSLVTGSFPLDPAKDCYATGWYPENNRKDGVGTAYNYFSSHNSSNLYRSLVGALGAYSENAEARKLLDLGLHLIFGKPYYAGTEDGMDTAGMYAVNGVAKVLYINLLFHFTFPEVHFNRHPFLIGVADWFSRMRPIGTEAELFCWADGNDVMNVCFPAWGEYFAWYIGDGAALKQYNIEHARLPSTRADGDLVNYLTPALSYTYAVFACSYYADVGHDQDAGYLPTPTEEDRLPSSKAFPGWAFASSGSTTDLSSYRDGLGFIFCCRPSALGGKNHDHPMDLSFELRAYGQSITENTCPNWEYGKIPQSHNTLTVNGIGPKNGTGMQRTAIQGRIFAFKTTNDYTYCAGEGKDLYPASTIAILSKVNRHLLMVRNKFFVVFDDMEAKQPATFSWIFHLLEDNLVLDPEPANPGTFNYTKTKTPIVLAKNYVYEGKPVSVYVSHIASREQLNVLDLSGAERMKNPITNIIVPLTPWEPDTRTHALWVSNKTPTTKFHFMTVIYPVKAGGVAPTITRLDDFTAEVTCGAEKDVISFDPKTRFPATLVVDLFGIPVPTNPGASGPGILPPP